MYNLTPEAVEEIVCVAVDESGIYKMARKYHRDPWQIRDIVNVYSDYRD